MNNLLFWPLLHNIKIIFSSSATLSTITCCDQIDLVLEKDQEQFVVISGLTGCQLSSLKNHLQEMAASKTNKLSWQDVLLISKSQLGQILLEIQKDNKSFAYFVIEMDMLQAWVRQLDLLDVVMQENENEKKNAHSNCCG